jgi:DNA-binding NarL/FixJ family response regulator
LAQAGGTERPIERVRPFWAPAGVTSATRQATDRRARSAGQAALRFFPGNRTDVSRRTRRRTTIDVMPNATTIHVLLAEDHPIYRQGLIVAIEAGLPGVRCTGAGTAAEALALLGDDRRFDAVLIDLKLPDRDGLALAADVRALWPTLACVIVSGSDDVRVADKAVALGCMGFVPKSLEPEAMVAALGRVLEGEPCFPPRGAGALGALKFTERQAAVLQAIARGCTSRTIAAELGIAERTVKDHLAVVYGRLDASTRAEAVARAAALGLIDLRASA